MFSLGLSDDTEVLAGDQTKKALVAGLASIAHPSTEELLVCLSPGGVFRQTADVVDPVFADVILQRPGAEIGPAITNDVL